MSDRTRPARICSVEGCGKPLSCKNMCQGHYLRVRKHGTPGRPELRSPQAQPRGDEHTCPRCEVSQPISEYPLRNGKHRSTCKSCTYADARAWRRRNPSRSKEFSRQNYAKHREARQAYAREHYQNNRDRYRATQVAYYAENRETIRETTRRWIAENPERYRAILRANDRRRRARLASLPVERYTPTDLLKRDGPQCVLCEGELDLDAKYPHPDSVTVEHLECISWPGSAGDVLANVALAHAFCNWSRNHRPHLGAATKRAQLLALETEARLRP